MAANSPVFVIRRSEPAKQIQARPFLTPLSETGETVTLWQVAGESINCWHRVAAKGRFPDDDIHDSIAAVLTVFPLRLPDRDVRSHSIDLIAHFSSSHRNSLLIGAAIEARVETRYSEDFADEMKYGAVSVVNRFA